MNLKNTLTKFTAVTTAAVCFVSFLSLPHDCTVYAADYTHSSGQHNGWKEWKQTTQYSLPQVDGKYFLSSGIQFYQDKTGSYDGAPYHPIKGNVTLCLNGKDLGMANNSKNIRINSGNVNIFNCQSQKSKIYTDYNGDNAITNSANLTIENCELYAHSENCYGIENNSTFNAINCNFTGPNGITNGQNSTLLVVQNSQFSVNTYAINLSWSCSAKISGSSISGGTGILYNSSGTLTVEGTNNINGNNDYGINCNGNLKLSGNNTITGKNAGIYLGSNKKITITGNLTNSTPISIETAVKPTDEAPVVLTDSSNTGLNDASKFVSADNKYRVVKDPQTGQLQLTTGAELHSMRSVSYNVEPSYTVVIPATVKLSQGNETKSSISVQDVSLEKGQRVNVSLTGATPIPDGTMFHVKSNNNVIDYTIKSSGRQVRIGDKLLIVTCDHGSGTAELTFSAPSDITFAGKYTGALMFTISVSS